MKKIILISGFIVFLLICLIAIYSISQHKDNFTENSNIYLNRQESGTFIKEDRDNYIKTLSEYDLIARGVSSSDNYINLVVNECLDFTDSQINKLNNCSIIAKKFFDNKYKWKFALINDVYEEGFPHTREDIIFLSPKIINYTDDNLIRILIHESIHIYQRYFKNEINNYLKNNGYTVSRRRDTEPLIRANPDLDEYIYKNKNNQELIYKYKSSNPSGINDIVPNINNEHPYEIMAYEIAEEYGRYKISKYKDI